MNRKLIWFSILSIFFLIWGMSRSVAAVPHREHFVQSTPPLVERTSAAPEPTQPALLPVTGSPRMGWGILLFYGLIGLAALTLILALLDSANQSTACCVQRKISRNETHEK